MQINLPKHFFSDYKDDFCHGHWLSSRPCSINKTRIAILLIPKNASQTISRNTDKTKWQRHFQRHLYSEYITDYAVMLRDPFNRWISGVVEYCYKNNIDIKTLDLNQMVFDEHTVSQYDHCYQLDITRCNFFVLEDSGIENLYKSYDISYKKITNANEAKNTQTKPELTRWLISQITDELKAKIKKYYSKDYELLDAYYAQKDT